MRTFVDHTVMFLLEKGEGDIVKTDTGYGQVSGVTVHFHGDRDPQVSVSVRRCRKDGTDDRRMGNVHTSAEIDTAPWVSRAREVVNAGGPLLGEEAG